MSPTAHVSPEQFADLAALVAGWRALEQDIRSFLAAVGDDDLLRVHEYRSLAGEPGRSPLWQMAQHLVNHGSYHRGQITTMLRQCGRRHTSR